MTDPHTSPGTTTARVLGVLSAVVAVLTPAAVAARPAFDPDPLGRLLVAAGLVPALVVLTAVPRVRRWAAVALVAGGVFALVGGATTMTGGSLLGVPVSPLLTWRGVVRGADVFAPVGLVLVGLAALLVGVGSLLRRRPPVVTGAMLGGLTAGWFGASASAYPAEAVLEGYGLSRADLPTLLTSAALGSAGALLLVVAVLRDRLVPCPTGQPSVPPEVRTRRRLVAAGLVGLVVLGLASLGADRWVRSTPVAELLPDPVLAGCAAGALGMDDATGGATAAELSRVLTLSCTAPTTGSPVVTDLTGLDAFGELVSLDLTGQQVTDISPLTDLEQLTSVELAGNRVRDLAPLAGRELLRLGLAGNPLQAWGPVPTMTSLQALDAADTGLGDTGPLAGLTGLTELDLSGTGVADLAPLADLTVLSEVSLAGGRVVDLTPLADADQLVSLDLSGNQVRDLTPVADAPYLYELDASSNRVADLAPLRSSPALVQLTVGGNPFTDLAVLVGAPSLAGVDLEGSDSTRLTGIEELRASGVFVGGLA